MKPRYRVKANGEIVRVKEFQAAEIGRLTSSWTTTLRGVNYDLSNELRTLQARARHEYNNNDYVKRFVGMMRSNVIGPEGVRLQAKTLTARGEMDTSLNDQIESQWSRWGRVGSCDVTGRLSWIDLQNLVIAGLAIDGEVLVRRVRNWRRNPFGYALQLIDPGRLSPKANDTKRNIEMGVERDDWGRPVNYYLSKKKEHSDSAFIDFNPQDFDIVPANEVLHIYLPEFAVQDRGIPAVAVALHRLRMLAGYEEAELVAARAGAAQVGFFERIPEAMAVPLSADDDDGIGNRIMDVEPGEWRELPPGYRANWIDPSHPNDAYGDFVKAMLRGMAAGLGVNYTSLANDLEGVNYSSIRHGALEERDTWKCLQRFMIEHFHWPIYMDWAAQSLETNQLPGGDRFDAQIRKVGRIEWQPRRWDWVDPQKQEMANQIAITTRTKSISQIIRESGREPEDVFEEIRAERERLQAMGIAPEEAIATGNGDERDED